LWDSGNFEYKDAKLNLKDMVDIKINVMEILLKASRRIDEMAVFSKLIPNEEMIFELSDEIRNKEEINLDQSELQLLNLFDGIKTVREISEEYGAQALEATDEIRSYRMLHSLITCGLIEESHDDYPAAVIASDDVDYSAIITVYNEVLQIICRNLETELGKKIFVILDECKSEVIARPKDVFKDFNPRNPVATNIHSILKIVEGYEDKQEVKALLVESFNEFMTGILNKVENIIGRQLTQEMLGEIDRIFYEFKQRQFNSPAMHQLMDDIKNILQTTEQQSED
jgi:hypothetical protein